MVKPRKVLKEVADTAYKGLKKVGKFVGKKLDNIEARAKFDEDKKANENMKAIQKLYPGGYKQYEEDNKPKPRKLLK